jgi:outer membrane receptor protein involved in Fe transport
MTRTALLCGLAACALGPWPAGLARAQAANPSTAPSEEVIVTATRSPEPLSRVPASASVVSAAQIRNTPAQGLDDVLRLTPGMTLNTIGPDVGHPTAYNEGMRGLPTTETRLLVLLDGTPVNDPFFGYIQWNRIPLDDIDRVEIVRGGGAPLWGDTAMGGVINVITRSPKTAELDLDAAGGSYGSYRLSGFGAYPVGDKLAISLNAAFSGTSGYQTTPASWSSFGSTTLRSPVYTPTSFNARNLGLKTDFAPTDDLTGSFTVNYHDNDQVLSTPLGHDAQQTWTYSGQIRKALPDGASITAAVFHDDSSFITNNPHLLTFTTEYNSNIHTTPVTDTGGSLIWSQDLPGVLRSYAIGVDAHGISGGDFANYFLPSGQLAVPTIIGSGRQLFVGGFIEARLVPIERLEIVGSVRYQFYRNYDGIDTFPPAIGAVPASNQYSTDPRINVRYAITDQIALRGAYYQSFRAPTLDELYRTYADTTAGIFEGNPFLKPETLEGGEVGLDFTRPGLRTQLTFYSTTIQNLITQRNLTPAENPTGLGVTCGFDPVTFAFLTCTRNVNAASAVARGFEAEADWDIGAGVSGVLAYTYADSRYTSDPVDPTAVGQRLEGVPLHNLSGTLTYAAAKGWHVSADLRWVSKSYGDPHPADNLIQNAHFVMDASADYPLTRHLTGYVQVQNLFDERYIAANSGGPPILGTPLEVLSGVRASFR